MWSPAHDSLDILSKMDISMSHLRFILLFPRNNDRVGFKHASAMCLMPLPRSLGTILTVDPSFIHKTFQLLGQAGSWL